MMLSPGKISLALLLAAGLSATASAQEHELGLGGAGPSSLGYVLVAGMAENTNSKTDLVRITPETTAGYVENIRLVGRNETQMALTNGGLISEGLESIGPFEGESGYDDIRGVAVAYEGNVAWYAGEGIESVEDLAGRTVSAGPPGSQLSTAGELILQAYGIRDEVEVLNLSYEESARAFVDGTIDAMVGGPPPYPAIMEASAQRPMNILPVDDEHLKIMQEISPYVPSTIPAGSYDWVSDDVDAVGYLTYLIAHKDVPAEAVHEILRVNLSPEGQEYLKSNHPLWNIWNNTSYIQDKGAFALEGMKLHPGAVSFWEEQGVEVPAEIKPE